MDFPGYQATGAKRAAKEDIGLVRFWREVLGCISVAWPLAFGLDPLCSESVCPPQPKTHPAETMRPSVTWTPSVDERQRYARASEEPVLRSAGANRSAVFIADPQDTDSRLRPAVVADSSSLAPSPYLVVQGSEGATAQNPCASPTSIGDKLWWVSIRRPLRAHDSAQPSSPLAPPPPAPFLLPHLHLHPR